MFVAEKRKDTEHRFRILSSRRENHQYGRPAVFITIKVRPVIPIVHQRLHAFLRNADMAMLVSSSRFLKYQIRHSGVDQILWPYIRPDPFAHKPIRHD